LTLGEDLPLYTVFEGVKGFVQYGGMKPADQKYKQPNHSDPDYAKARFSLGQRLNKDDPTHMAFINNGLIVDRGLAAKVESDPHAFVTLDSASLALPKEVQMAIVRRGHYRFCQIDQLKDVKSPDKGVWPPSTDFKVRGANWS
jgi:hypothetical protein